MVVTQSASHLIERMIRFILVQNKQGKSRLAKFYVPYDDDEKTKLKGEVHRLIAPRDTRNQSNFVEVRDRSEFDPSSTELGFGRHIQFRSHKLVYRRYAGLFFCVCVDANDNELAYLEAIHLFVEVLGALRVETDCSESAMTDAGLFQDAFFGNVCELDLVFNFYKVYAILDEVFLAGEIEETSKNIVLNRLDHCEPPSFLFGIARKREDLTFSLAMWKWKDWNDNGAVHNSVVQNNHRLAYLYKCIELV